MSKLRIGRTSSRSFPAHNQKTPKPKGNNRFSNLEAFLNTDIYTYSCRETKITQNRNNKIKNRKVVFRIFKQYIDTVGITYISKQKKIVYSLKK